jgi:predicted AlkP superfamily pyrophosphatase or phosphodiesterase
MKSPIRPIFRLFNFWNILFLSFLLTLPSSFSLNIQKPRLFIIITVDQFRADYLERYDKVFEGGFRRLRDEGHRFDKALVDHAPTLSWPGHTTIATGAHPKTHGISTNAVIVDKTVRQLILYDAQEHILGHSQAISFSPRRIRVTGIADWIHAADPEARTVALSTGTMALCYGGRAQSDRAKNQVYWLDPTAGQFVTTSFYRDDYPAWLEAFNSETLPAYKKVLVWENSVPREYWYLARPDEKPYEGDGIHTSFPHKIEHRFKEINQRAIDSWFDTYSPHANEALFALTKKAIAELRLGRRNSTDFLSVAIKSTDRIGHDYGPCSLEQLDNILRIDRELGKFMDFLDETIGKDGYIMVLTADHGAPNIVEYEIEQGRPAKRVSEEEIKALLWAVEEFIERYSGPEEELPTLIAKELEKADFVARAMTPEELSGDGPADRVLESYRNSCVPENKTTFPLWTNQILYGKVSPRHPGNYGVIVEFKENAQLYTARSAHASSYLYDQEVPIIFFGNGIQPGISREPAQTIDIAPTLARLAGIPFPDTVDGKILRVR